jgi:hypothetical protein
MNGAAFERSGSTMTSRPADAPRLDRHTSVLGVVDDDTDVAQRLHRHRHVRLARDRRALVAQREALVEPRAGQQQRRTRTGRRGGVDPQLAAADAAGAADRERQPAGAAVVHLDAERAQARHDRAHRALAGARVAVERDVAGWRAPRPAAGTA